MNTKHDINKIKISAYYNEIFNETRICLDLIWKYPHSKITIINPSLNLLQIKGKPSIFVIYVFIKAVLWRNWYPYTCTCTTFNLNKYLFYLEVLKLSEHLNLMIYWKGDVKKICCGFHVFGLLVCLIISILLVYFAHLLRQGLKIYNTYTYTCTCRLLNFNRFLVA